MRRTFRFSFGMTIFCTFFLLVFISLGCWQLSRYHYKRDLKTTFQERMQMSPVNLLELQNYQDLRFLPLKAHGHYVNQYMMLLDNRIYQGRAGYEVITPFKINGQKKLLLINRGWVAKRKYQKPPPFKKLKAAENQEKIVGYIDVNDQQPFRLGPSLLNPGHWPLHIQAIDIQKIEKLTQAQFYPFVLRLNAGQANGFIRNWNFQKILPERHLGYAVQWFLLAFAILIAFFIFSYRQQQKVKK